jgi:hypothetical protein
MAGDGLADWVGLPGFIGHKLEATTNVWGSIDTHVEGVYELDDGHVEVSFDLVNMVIKPIERAGEMLDPGDLAGSYLKILEDRKQECPACGSRSGW